MSGELCSVEKNWARGDREVFIRVVGVPIPLGGRPDFAGVHAARKSEVALGGPGAPRVGAADQ